MVAAEHAAPCVHGPTINPYLELGGMETGFGCAYKVEAPLGGRPYIKKSTMYLELFFLVWGRVPHCVEPTLGPLLWETPI